MKIVPKDRYVMTYPEDNSLVLVSVDKFLDRFKKDSPEFFIGADTKISGSQLRIKSSMDFIQNYKENPKWINSKTGERSTTSEEMFVPTLASMYNGRLGVTNGRHRMVALKNLGYTHAYIEVPQDQVKLFSSLA